MRLTGARVAVSADHAIRADLCIVNGRVSFSSDGEEETLDLSGHLLLPGLMNAHDHLEFALYPQLGRRQYSNMREWAADVYRPEDSPVREHRAVDRKARFTWGALRNLLCGVTTVCHHNPYDECFAAPSFPIHVLRSFSWAHSLAFAPDLAERFHARCPGTPFIVHAAEGTDDIARAEVRQLDALGVLGPDTVLVHGFGLGRGDLALLIERGCSLIWCPCSNLNTYGVTMDRSSLRSGLRIALGSDSPITGKGDLLDDIVAAGHAGGLSKQEVYRMVTSVAADILGLRDGQGTIREGGVADLVAVRDLGQSPAEAIFGLRPELVMVGGCVKLLSEGRPGFQRICVEGSGTSWVEADVWQLHSITAEHLGSDIRLSGRRISL